MIIIESFKTESIEKIVVVAVGSVNKKLIVYNISSLSTSILSFQVKDIVLSGKPSCTEIISLCDGLINEKSKGESLMGWTTQEKVVVSLNPSVTCSVAITVTVAAPNQLFSVEIINVSLVIKVFKLLSSE